MMNNMKKHQRIGGLIVIAALLLLVGCNLISGTFISVFLITDADFTTQTGFYFYNVDLTEEDVWNDHNDEIQDIDLIGFELWITNHEATARTFSIYLDEASQPVYTTVSEVQSNATIVLDGLSLAAGPEVQTHITYGSSFSYLKNIDTMKDLVESGTFHYYGLADGGTTAGYTIDSVRIIITFTAGI